MAQHDAKQRFLNRTLEVWQPRTCRPLTDEDARQIVENMAGFMTILAEWEAAAETSPEPAPRRDDEGS